MKAYHNKPELKLMMVEEAVKHREQDQIIKVHYEKAGEDGKFQGCAVGCTLHSVSTRLGVEVSFGNHGAYEIHLGIPRILARLEDGIFEQLPTAEAMTWPQRFLEAIPVGADLSQVGDKFLHWLLVDPTDGVIKFAKTERTKQVIQNVADLYVKKIAGETIDRKTWWSARQAADAADAYAADAYAADAAAAYAAAADADAAADVAADDAAAVVAVVAAAARKKARVRQSEKLLELMAAAPVTA